MGCWPAASKEQRKRWIVGWASGRRRRLNLRSRALLSVLGRLLLFAFLLLVMHLAFFFFFFLILFLIFSCRSFLLLMSTSADLVLSAALCCYVLSWHRLWHFSQLSSQRSRDYGSKTKTRAKRRLKTFYVV